MGSPRESLYGILMLMERRKRSPSAGIPELDEIVLAARHEKTHRRMPFNTLDVPSMAGKDTFLAAFRKGRDVYSGAVAGCGGATPSGKKLSPRTASRCAAHAVRLFILSWKYYQIGLRTRCRCLRG